MGPSPVNRYVCAHVTGCHFTAVMNSDKPSTRDVGHHQLVASIWILADLNIDDIIPLCFCFAFHLDEMMRRRRAAARWQVGRLGPTPIHPRAVTAGYVTRQVAQQPN